MEIFRILPVHLIYKIVQINGLNKCCSNLINLCESSYYLQDMLTCDESLWPGIVFFEDIKNIHLKILIKYVQLNCLEKICVLGSCSLNLSFKEWNLIYELIPFLKGLIIESDTKAATILKHLKNVHPSLKIFPTSFPLTTIKYENKQYPTL